MAQAPSEVAHSIARAAVSKKATEILILDLRELSELTDFFIICGGDSEAQVRAIADQILESQRSEGLKEWHVEGYAQARWVLIDYVEVVAHIFLREVREYYGLEDLWGDAPAKRIGNEDTQGQEATD